MTTHARDDGSQHHVYIMSCLITLATTSVDTWEQEIGYNHLILRYFLRSWNLQNEIDDSLVSDNVETLSSTWVQSRNSDFIIDDLVQSSTRIQ